MRVCLLELKQVTAGAFASTSRSRASMASVPKPEKRGTAIAPMRPHASNAIDVSGIMGR